MAMIKNIKCNSKYKQKRMNKIFLTLAVALMVFLPMSALAATGLGDASTKLGQVTKGSGLESGDLSTLEGSAGLVIKGALSLVGTIFLILTVYAGILWMTASGKEEQVEKASKIIKASVIGLFIVMSSYAITYFITTNFGAGSGSSSSSQSMGSEQCTKAGGYCISSKAKTEVVGGKNITIDPNDPCDPDGVGSSDPFTGTVLGLCSQADTVCCELAESAGDGTLKCKNMGGTCVSGSSGCPSGTTQKGECDTGAWDPYCCIPNTSATTGS